MPIQTDLSVSPYFDDFDPAKNYDKILFKPGVAVQARELNQLQSILQNQIEKFGDNIYVKGTIIDGCNFFYNSNYSYVKIKDLDTDGLGVTVNNYVGLFAKDSSNLVSKVVEAVAGYEAQAPDLNTLYVRYINSGDSGTQQSYGADSTLTLFDANNSIFSVKVNGTGAGFSNSDAIHFFPAITVSSNTGAYAVGEQITGGTSQTVGVIAEINSTAIANTLVLKVSPKPVDLSNTQIDIANLQFIVGEAITSNTTSVTATVANVLGAGAAASPTTDSAGRVKSVTMSAQGNGYVLAPYASVKTSNTTANFNTLSLEARNYAAKVTSGASLTNPVGDGYSFSVSEGVIYQKGYFLSVAPQSIIVSKYDNVPDQVYVGFNTAEAIVTSTQDPTLLDNSTGTTNYQAPGADRLQLTPELITLSEADAIGNTDFFAVTAFSLGNPFLQNQQTAYSALGDEMAQRTFDTSGDFVLDPFVLSTKSSTSPSELLSQFRVNIDPGYAYINGNRVRTFTNYSLNVASGTDTQIIPDAQVRLSFGNYTLVKELAGIFDFRLGDYVTLYDTAQSFLSTQANFDDGTIGTPSGTAIGTARFRSLTLESGSPGTPAATYRLYLYDINMNAGKNFRSVQSIYYNSGGVKAIADTVLSLDPFTSTNVASVVNTNASQMVFNIGPKSIKSVGDINYTYRFKDGSNTAGVVTYTLSPGTDIWAYPKSGTLTSTELASVLIIPKGNGVNSANAAGSYSVTTNTTAGVITANSGTPNFVTSFNAGDYLKIFGATEYTRISAVTNSTSMIVVGNSTTLTTNSAANVVQFFPNNVPISLVGRPGVTANVNSTGKLLTVDLGFTLAANVNIDIIADVKSVNITPTSKTTNRDTYVKINFANNTNGNTGPWALGHPDIFRMKNVYVGTNSTILSATNVVGLTDVTNHFYIDHNQNPDYFDYGYLYRKPTSNLVLTTGQGLIVGFDHFTNAAAGFTTLGSYSVDDTVTFDTLDATKTGGDINTLEISEMHTADGKDYDLIDVVDFRPRVTATANVSAGLVSNSTVNPSIGSATTRFAASAAVGFPTPDTVFMANTEYYIGRVDRVVIDEFGVFKSIKGNPAVQNQVAPDAPADALSINTVYIPPYPSVPQIKSDNLIKILDKKIASIIYTTARVSSHTIQVPVTTETQLEQTQPTRYTVADIHNLERRIAALEYYVSLSQLEQSVKDLVIPSSLNGAINRFKYGFFADNFINNYYSDTDNPEYHAQIENQEVVPSDGRLNYEYEFNVANSTTNASVTGKMLTLPYGNFVLLNQSVATSGTGASANNTVYRGTLIPNPRTFSIAIYKVQNS